MRGGIPTPTTYHRLWTGYYWSHVVSDGGEISEHVPGDEPRDPLRA